MIFKNKKLLISAAIISIAGLIAAIILNPIANPPDGWTSIGTLGIEKNLEATVNNLPKPYIVQSGSMEPAIKTGSLVFSLPSSSYQQGDIITFRPKGRSQDTVTHRIVFKLYPEGIDSEPTYITAGDANEDVDNSRVTNDQIIGKTALTLPYLGHLADYAKTPQGFILFVIVPATIIIYEELRLLKREMFKRLSKHFNRLNKRFLNKNNSNKATSIEERGLPKASILLPIFGAFLVMTTLSASYFFDIENSLGNILGAASDFETTPSPTPTPGVAGTLVINEVMPDTDCFQGNTEAQWIELYNGTDSSINPKNYKITDGTNTIDLVTANNLSISAGGFLLLSHNNSIWNDNTGCWDDNGIQTGNLGGQLNIDVQHLQLIGTDGTTVIDDVKWSGSTGLNPGINESVERDPDGEDTATGSNFNPDDFIVRETPQPGL